MGKQRSAAVQRGICPYCGFRHLQQVGRCVYRAECHARLYQGILKDPDPKGDSSNVSVCPTLAVFTGSSFIRNAQQTLLIRLWSGPGNTNNPRKETGETHGLCFSNRPLPGTTPIQQIAKPTLTSLT